MLLKGGYTDFSASAKISAIPAQPRSCAILAPDWLFEIKWDRFRALLYSGADGVRPTKTIRAVAA